MNCLIFFSAGRSVSVRLTIVCSFFFVSFSAAFSVLSGEVRHDPLGLAPELAGGQLTGGGDVLADLGGGRRKRCNFPNSSFIKKTFISIPGRLPWTRPCSAAARPSARRCRTCPG